MDFEKYLKMHEPVLTEDELRDMEFKAQIEIFEAEEAEIKATDAWVRSFELDEDEINALYEDTH